MSVPNDILKYCDVFKSALLLLQNYHFGFMRHCMLSFRCTFHHPMVNIFSVATPMERILASCRAMNKR